MTDLHEIHVCSTSFCRGLLHRFSKKYDKQLSHYSGSKT